ncbi:MAG TPA: hypothetical protein VJ954_10020, partial [Ignavibacteriaceae bacterium]|nr:hypothetical protein [Ignavibacteriaceae bacterium]
EENIMKIRYTWLTLIAAMIIILFGFYVEIEAQNMVNALQTKIEKLSDQSDLVVVGKVSEIHSKWNKDKSRIYTDVTVDVEEFVKGGEPGTRIVIKHPGGEVGGVGEWYSYAPKFKTTEEVMLFLHKNKNGNLNVTKGAEGKFLVKKDNAVKTKILENGVSIENIKSMLKNKQREK